MQIIPAIDLKDGCVVRYVQGKKEKKVYSRDPLKTARHWAKMGAKIIHVVDLDGAFSGKPKNLGIVKEMIKNTNIKIEVGGGLRKIEAVKDLLACGAYRVVLGTRAAQDADFLKHAFRKFKDKIIVSIDAQDGLVAVCGWRTKIKKLEALDFALSLKEIGFKQAIYTDISKDGTLKGPNIKGIKSLLKNSGLKIIASGGISCLKDIFKLKLLEKNGLAGIIVGKALYEGRFTLPQALNLS